MILIEILQCILLILWKKLHYIARCYGFYFFWSMSLIAAHFFSISIPSLEFLFMVFVHWAFIYVSTICEKNGIFRSFWKLVLNYKTSAMKKAEDVYAVPVSHRTVLCYVAHNVKSTESDSEGSDEEHGNLENIPDNLSGPMERDDSEIPYIETWECAADKVVEQSCSSSPKCIRKRKNSSSNDFVKRQRPTDGVVTDEQSFNRKVESELEIEDNANNYQMESIDKTADADQSIRSHSNEKLDHLKVSPKRLEDNSENEEMGNAQTKIDSKSENFGSDEKYNGDTLISEQEQRGEKEELFSNNEKKEVDSAQNASQKQSNIINFLIKKYRSNQDGISPLHGNEQSVSPEASLSDSSLVSFSRCPKKKYIKKYYNSEKKSLSTSESGNDEHEEINSKSTVQNSETSLKSPVEYSKAENEFWSNTSCLKSKAGPLVSEQLREQNVENANKKDPKDGSSDSPWKLCSYEGFFQRTDEYLRAALQVSNATARNSVNVRDNASQALSSTEGQIQQHDAVKDIPVSSRHSKIPIDSKMLVFDETSIEFQTMILNSFSDLRKSVICHGNDVQRAYSQLHDEHRTNETAASTTMHDSVKKLTQHSEKPTTSRGPIVKPHAYKAYPGIADNPLDVKKDARFQKKFYKERPVVLPRKLGKAIRRANISGSHQNAFDEYVSETSPEKQEQQKRREAMQKYVKVSTNALPLDCSNSSPVKSPSSSSCPSEHSSDGEQKPKRFVILHSSPETLKNDENTEEPSNKLPQMPSDTNDPKNSDFKPENKRDFEQSSSNIEHEIPFVYDKPKSQNSPKSPNKHSLEPLCTEEMEASGVQPEFENDFAACSPESEERETPRFAYENPMSQNSEQSSEILFSDQSSIDELNISDCENDFKDVSMPCLSEVEKYEILSFVNENLMPQISSESPNTFFSNISHTEESQIFDYQSDFKDISISCSQETAEQEISHFLYKKQGYPISVETHEKPFSVSVSSDCFINNIDGTISYEIKAGDSEASSSSELLQYKHSDSEVDSTDGSESSLHSLQGNVPELLKIYKAKAVEKMLQQFKRSDRDGESFHNADELLTKDKTETEDFEESEQMEAVLRKSGSPDCF